MGRFFVPYNKYENRNAFFSFFRQAEQMDRLFLFDVDGTLTQSGQPIDGSFADFLMTFFPQEDVYLVTGSAYARLEKQLPSRLMGAVNGVFACNGNQIIENGEVSRLHDHEFPKDLLEYCLHLIEVSPFCWRTGHHISQRTGMLNISTVGRNADRLDRKRYVDFDKVSNEREYFVEAIMRTFPDYEVMLGGEISVDIVPKGWNKSRVYRQLRRQYPSANFHFFADGVREFHNDLPLAREIERADAGHVVHPVTSVGNTRRILEEEYFASSEHRAYG